MSSKNEGVDRNPGQLNSRENEDDFGVITNSMKAHQIQKQALSPGAKLIKLITEGTDNPWVRLPIYCLACLFTSCIYFGWQDYSKMMIWGGAYKWRCEGQEPGAGLDDPDDPASCLDQSKAVSGLYSFANGSEFVCAAIAGILLDSIGPRFTALLGESLQCLAILLMALSARSFQMYIPAIVLTGACVNIICFPALTVMEAWPNHQAFAISIIVGCQSSASIIAPVMARVWDKHPNWTYKGIWLSFLAIFWLPITLAYIWALPRRRNYKALLVAPDQQTDITENADPAKQEEAPVKHDGSVVEEDAPPEVSKDQVSDATPKTTKEAWKKFGREVLTLDLMLMALFCALLMFQFAYYPAVLRDAVSTSISDFVGWLTPLQGPFSFIIGFCMDYTGTVLIMYLMCATLVFVNLSCALGSDLVPLMRAVGFIFVFFQSATYNVKYTFVNEMYDPFNFGKLVGFLGIAGGLGVYLSNPLTITTNYSLVFKILVAIGFVMAAVTTYLFVRQFVQNKTHKTIQGVAQTNRIIKKKEAPVDEAPQLDV